MHRRTFLILSGGVTIAVSAAGSTVLAASSATERVGMGTVIFRSRFEQTKPKGMAELKNGRPHEAVDIFKRLERVNPAAGRPFLAMARKAAK